MAGAALLLVDLCQWSLSMLRCCCVLGRLLRVIRDIIIGQVSMIDHLLTLQTIPHLFKISCSWSEGRRLVLD